jgi:hypothetical protein
VFCFDVIEHIEDPFAFLATLERTASVVVVNFLEELPDDTHLHHHLPIGELVAYAARRGLLHYRVYHGRSHLVAYGTEAANALSGLRSRLELLKARSAGPLGRLRAACPKEDRSAPARDRPTAG